jgi:hypothetical protein
MGSGPAWTSGPARRRSLGLAIAAALLVGLPGIPPRPSPDAWAADAPAPDAALVKRIADCRAAGVRWLRTQLGEDGSFKIAGSNHACPAETAFFAFVLRSAGATRNDPDLVRAMDRVRKEFGGGRVRPPLIGHETYGFASLLLALERLATDAPGDPPQAAPLTEADRALAADCRKLLADVQVGDGTFSYGVRGSGWHDHSNTYWALLGLRAAALLGLKTEAAVWRRAADHLVKVQEKSGPKVPRFAAVGSPDDGYAPQPVGVDDHARGWGYLDDGRPTGSMTAACVVSVALCRDALFAAGALDRDVDLRTAKSLRDGLAWMDLNFATDRNPGANAPGLPDEVARLVPGIDLGVSLSGYHYDWLAALERAGSLLRLSLLGKRDWFRETAVFLTEKQKADGRWNLTSVDTCCALLALSRTAWRIDARAWK